MDAVVTWAVPVMLAFAPPDRAKVFPGHEETTEVRTARYEAIAEAMADVVFDPDIKPAYGGKKGRLRTMIAMLAVGWHESNFDHDVDVGPCYRGEGAGDGRCDHGTSACIMQIHLADGKTPEGWTQADLFADRHKCFKAALRGIRASFSSCRHLEEKHWFSAYASGTCEGGHEASEALYALVGRFSSQATLPSGEDTSFMRPKSNASAPLALDPAALRFDDQGGVLFLR